MEIGPSDLCVIEKEGMTRGGLCRGVRGWELMRTGAVSAGFVQCSSSRE